MRKITTITPLTGHRLECVFEDGTKKIADISSFLSKETFRLLSDTGIFVSALHNRGYFIEWKNYNIDLSADTLWDIGEPFEAMA